MGIDSLFSDLELFVDLSCCSSFRESLGLRSGDYGGKFATAVVNVGPQVFLKMEGCN